MSSSFDGAAFHPSLDDGRATGRIVVDSTTVRFESEGASVEMPLDQLAIRLGGASDRLVFMTHALQPDWAVYTSDQTILRTLEATGHPDVLRGIAELRRRRTTGRAVTLGIFLAIFGVLALLYTLKDPVVGFVARGIPPSFEAQLGDAVLAEYRLSRSFIEDPRVLGAVRSIARPLVEHLDTDRYEINIHVADDPEVNAFALPGGNLVVNSGLILRAESAEEVAGVLAHEIAHVTEQHSVRQVLSTIGIWALIQAVLGDSSGVLAILTDSGATLLTMSFSRDSEREADEEGLALLRRSRIDPRGMLTFFEKLREEEERLGSLGDIQRSLQFLSTHPATDERIDHLRKAIDSEPPGSKNSIAIDFEALQNSLSQT